MKWRPYLDYYYKFGKRPPLDLEQASESLDKIKSLYDLPFVRIQVRYDAYQQYAPRVDSILSEVGKLAKLVESKSWNEASVCAKEVIRGLRPAGMLATILLSPDSVTNEALLMRYYINEASFKLLVLQDALAEENRDSALETLSEVRSCLNSFVFFTNQAIPAKVGKKFDKVV